jgi:hypothetical protein
MNPHVSDGRRKLAGRVWMPCNLPVPDAAAARIVLSKLQLCFAARVLSVRLPCLLLLLLLLLPALLLVRLSTHHVKL